MNAERIQREAGPGQYRRVEAKATQDGRAGGGGVHQEDGAEEEQGEEGE